MGHYVSNEIFKCFELFAVYKQINTSLTTIAVIEPTASFHDGSDYSLPRRNPIAAYKTHSAIQEEEVHPRSSRSGDDAVGMPEVQ